LGDILREDDFEDLEFRLAPSMLEGSGRWQKKPQRFAFDEGMGPDPVIERMRDAWRGGSLIKDGGDALYKTRAGIGEGEVNGRIDVAKAETLLEQAGAMDLTDLEGPTGFWADDKEAGILKFQTANGLKTDGKMLPHGETMRTLESKLAPKPVAHPKPACGMAGHGRVRRTFERVWRVIRKWPRTSFAALAAFVLLVVPIWPFTPECGTRYKPVKGAMTEEYRYILKNRFRAFGVYYWGIGGVILFRVLPFLDGSELMDQHDGIVNAQHKAALAAADEVYVAQYVTKNINGKVYRVSPRIYALRDPDTGRYDSDSCRFMYEVVTGGPPPDNLE